MAGIIGLLGGALAFIGWIWIVVMAFQDGETVWGVISIFCGIAAIIYGIMNFGRASIPLALMGAGLLFQVVAGVMQGAGG